MASEEPNTKLRRCSDDQAPIVQNLTAKPNNNREEPAASSVESDRAAKVAYMIPQAQTVSHAPSAPAAAENLRSAPKRWPMAASILGAVAASIALWTIIVWIISLVMSLF